MGVLRRESSKETFVEDVDNLLHNDVVVVVVDSVVDDDDSVHCLSQHFGVSALDLICLLCCWS